MKINELKILDLNWEYWDHLTIFRNNIIYRFFVNKKIKKICVMKEKQYKNTLKFRYFEDDYEKFYYYVDFPEKLRYRKIDKIK